ncbi:hypothetical protein ETB97_005937 [Aspergillus alliaceus]|uniref:Uncharacterized protein n=1 Tax=Petromyces alliaceus TaxID=209559 RepID=A0A8H6E3R8_PETAA|nr:hypothetical protein ETB97_005937 [Aspergillus burnettii]
MTWVAFPPLIQRPTNPLRCASNSAMQTRSLSTPCKASDATAATNSPPPQHKYPTKNAASGAPDIPPKGVSHAIPTTLHDHLLTKPPTGGGPNTWTVVTHSNGEPRSVDSNNGIVTAPDEDGASDPLATLSVNPTMVKTATGTDAPKTSIPSSILTAPSAAADPNQGDAEASPSTSLSFATSAATAKASGSPSSPSFTPSATATGAAAGRPVLAASLVGAMLAPVAVNWL